LGNATNWSAFLGGAWQDGGAATGRPTFYRADVASPLPAGHAMTVGLRMKGLSAGSAWVNGHNLGFYHEGTILYVPEPWLTASGNTVVVFDRQGRAPAAVQFETIEDFARYGAK